MGYHWSIHCLKQGFWVLLVIAVFIPAALLWVCSHDCMCVSRGAGRERVDWSRSKGWSSGRSVCVCGLNQAVALFLQVWDYFCGLWKVGTHPLWKCVTLRMQLLKTDPPHTWPRTQTDTQRTMWDALRENAIFNHKTTKPDLFLVQNGGDFIVSTHFTTFLTGFFSDDRKSSL